MRTHERLMLYFTFGFSVGVIIHLWSKVIL